MGDMMPELRTVKRYAEQERQEAQQYPRLKSAEEAQQAFQDRKQAQKEKDAANSKNLLTDNEKKIIRQLLDGTVTLEQLEGKDINLKGVREVYEAAAHYEMIDKQIRRYQAELRQQRQDEADKLLGSSLYWKDKKHGISYIFFSYVYAWYYNVHISNYSISSISFL